MSLDEPMPLCPDHLRQACSSSGIFVHDNGASCPLCGGDTYGDYLLCGHCATEAEVCVFDARPVDGSSSVPPAWLATLAADRRAAYDAIPRLTAVDLQRLRHGRRVTGTWRSTAPTGRPRPHAFYLHLATGSGDFLGVLARVRQGRFAEISRFIWSLRGDLLCTTPLATLALPAGAWEQPLQLGPTEVEVTSPPSGAGARTDRYLSFPDRPETLAPAGWHFQSFLPEFALAQQLEALVRGDEL